jgi:hypothetical protein
MIRSISAVDNGCFLMGGVTGSPDGDLWAVCADSTGYAPEMGIETGGEQLQLLLGTNPVRGTLSLVLPEGSNLVSVRDICGRTVYEREAGEGLLTIQLLELPSGVYSVTAGQGIEQRFTLLR